MNKNKRTLILSILAIVVIVGGFTIYNMIVPTKIKKSINTHLSTALLPTTKDFYNIGETVKINDISLKIDKMKKSNGNKLSKPDEGLEYLIITLTAKNESNSKRSYGDDFQLQDAKGQIIDPAVTMIDAYHTFKSGNIAPKGEVTGTITFLATKDAMGLSLNYNWDVLRHKIVRFKLN